MIHEVKNTNLGKTALENADRFCVFQSGVGWFGFPALAVHAVVPRPELSRIPCSDPILSGLAHIQNEFVPVISFQALTEIQYERRHEGEQQIIIVDGVQGHWGLLIDQAIALAALEPTYSASSESVDHWSSVTVGSASFQKQVIQILDPNAMYQYVANLLEMFWRSDNPAAVLETTCNQ